MGWRTRLQFSSFTCFFVARLTWQELPGSFFWGGGLEVECGKRWALAAGGAATRILATSETHRRKISGQACRSREIKARGRNTQMDG